MSTDPSDEATSPPPTIHEAGPMPGPLGVVWYAAEVDFEAAVARRRAGLDVVVRGNDLAADRVLAAAIEAAVGRGRGRRSRTGEPALILCHTSIRSRGVPMTIASTRRKAR